MNKNIRLAEALVPVAEELEDKGLIEEANEIDDVINLLLGGLSAEMTKEAQLIPEKYQGTAMGSGAGIGAGLGLGLPGGWKGKLLGGLLGGAVGAGAGYLATKPPTASLDNPDIFHQIDTEILTLAKRLNDLRTMKASLLARNSSPELAEKYEEGTLAPSQAQEKAVETAVQQSAG